MRNVGAKVVGAEAVSHGDDEGPALLGDEPGDVLGEADAAGPVGEVDVAALSVERGPGQRHLQMKKKAFQDVFGDKDV